MMPIIAHTVAPVTQEVINNVVFGAKVHVGIHIRTPVTINRAVVVGLEMDVTHLFAQHLVTTEDCVLRLKDVNVHCHIGATVTAVNYCVQEKRPVFQGRVVFLVPVAVLRDLKIQVRDVLNFRMKITNQRFCLAN